MVRTPILIHYGCKFRSPQHWFTSLEDAQLTLNAWRHDYNNVRPHSSLGQQAPAHFGSGGDVSLAHTLVELWALKTSTCSKSVRYVKSADRRGEFDRSMQQQAACLAASVAYASVLRGRVLN